MTPDTPTPAEPTPAMLEAFRHGFQQQLAVRHKARFKTAPTAHERMSAEEAGLRAMLKAAPDDWRATPPETAQPATPEPAEALPTWVLLIRPGMAPVRKGPFYDDQHTEAMLRGLYALHADSTCIVIDMPHVSYPESGREWLGMIAAARESEAATQAQPATQAVAQQPKDVGDAADAAGLFAPALRASEGLGPEGEEPGSEGTRPEESTPPEEREASALGVQVVEPDEWAGRLFDGFSSLMESAKARCDIEGVALAKSMRDSFAGLYRTLYPAPAQASAPSVQVVEPIPMNDVQLLAGSQILVEAIDDEFMKRGDWRPLAIGFAKSAMAIRDAMWRHSIAQASALPAAPEGE